MTNVTVHPLADVQTNKIGDGTEIWQFAIILNGAVIGKNCNINCHTFIENDVKIGNEVTVKSGVFIWDGIEIGNNVFLGPNVTFVNDKYPRSKQYLETFQNTKVEKYASVGAGSIILGGITIGEYSLVAAGSVVTKNVPPFSLVLGNPARVIGKVNTEVNVTERFQY